MDTSSSTASSPTLSVQPLADATQEHPLYHFHDGSLAFELEGMKYRVHSSLLARHCGFRSTWAEDLSNPTTSRISRADMDAFLSMIYLATYEYVDLTLSTETWTSILRLATMWKADPIRDLAIRMLADKVSALDKLLLCREYDVSSWLAPACAALALSPDPLTIAQATELQKPDIVLVFTAREAVNKGRVDATEEAISTWIAGFLSNAGVVAEPSRIEETPALVSQPPATPAPVASVPSLPPMPTQALEPECVSEKKYTFGTIPNAEPSAPFSSQSQVDAALASKANSSTDTSFELLEKSSDSHKAEDTTRPASTSDVSLFRAQSDPAPSGSQEAEPSSLVASHVLPVQTVNPPIVLVRTAGEKISDAVDAIRTQRYDDAMDYLTMDNLKTVAKQVAPSSIEIVYNPQRPGVGNIRRLRLLLRAVMRRVVNNPGFIPCGAQFVAALSTQPSLKGVNFAIAFDVDMQSLSAAWAEFRAGRNPAADRGGIMVEVSTHTRGEYKVQMGHAKGFFRTLVRLGVLPATNTYVEMLVQKG